MTSHVVRSLSIRPLFAAVLVACSACSASAPADNAETSEHAQVSDIRRMIARGDGSFDVECTDGREEIVSATDVAAGQVCKRIQAPASPFEANACVGTPMTEASARQRMGGSSTPVQMGTFDYAIRLREAQFQWNGRWDITGYVWKEAPRETLVAWRETGLASSTGAKATFSKRGKVELANDAGGAPYLRLVGDAASVVGPDTSRFMRLVSEPIRPWRDARAEGPRFALEESNGANGGTWSRVTEWGWTVETSSLEVGGLHRSWWFSGDVTVITTDRCAQFISAQSGSTLSPVSAALGLFLTFD